MFFVRNSTQEDIPTGAVVDLFARGKTLIMQDAYGENHAQKELKGSWKHNPKSYESVELQHFFKKVSFRPFEWINDSNIINYLKGPMNEYFIQTSKSCDVLPAAGWKLHISANSYADYIYLLNTLVPWLESNDILYKVVRLSVWNSFTEGIQKGKFITIYLNKANIFHNLPSSIKEILFDENNIEVPGELHLAGRIYARYGSFKGPTIPDQFGNQIPDVRGIACPQWIKPLTLEDIF